MDVFSLQSIETKCNNGVPFVGFILGNDGVVSGLTTGNVDDGSQYNPSRYMAQGSLLSPECCNKLISDYPNLNLQLTNNNECIWSEQCDILNVHKLILSPEDNFGALFDVDMNEECYLQVSFDYILMFNCETLMACAQTEVTIDSTVAGFEDCYLMSQTLSSVEAHCFVDLNEFYNLPENTQSSFIEHKDIAINEYNQVYSDFNTCWTNWQTEFSVAGMNGTCASYITELINNINLKIIELDGLRYQFFLTPNDNGLANQILVIRESIDIDIQNLMGMLSKCGGDIITNYGCDIISLISGIQLETSVEVVSARTIDAPFYYETSNTLNTVNSQTFFNITPDFATYISGNTNTGLLFTGDCESAINCVLNGLGSENCQFVSANTFNSSWLHYTNTITEPAILDLIRNQQIKIGIKLNGCVCDFSLLLDNIQLNKICTKIEKTNTIVNTSPGFSLQRSVDNKKSWIYNDTSHVRTYDLTMRDTNYGVEHAKLVINTKEVDINLDGAAAIECNVFDYLQNNDCITSYPFCTELTAQTLTAETQVVITNYHFIGGLSGWGVAPSGWSWVAPTTARFSKSPYSNLSQQCLIIGHTYRIIVHGSNTDNHFQISLDGALTAPATPSAYISPIYHAFSVVNVILVANDTKLVLFVSDGGETTNLDSVEVYDITIETSTICLAETSIDEMLSTPISVITNVQEFAHVIQTELIDVKSRKVLSAYPTMRYIYDSYNDPASVGCSADSRHYNYCMVNQFISLIGDYWVDIIEQVVPATTIWGSSYVYRNTIFDQPKFEYKRSTLFYCLSSEETLDCIIAQYTGVTVEINTSVIETTNCIDSESDIDTCSDVFIRQIDDGSEFYGKIRVIRDGFSDVSNDSVLLGETVLFTEI